MLKRIVVLAAILSGLHGHASSAQTPDGAPAPAVVTMTVRRQELDRNSEFIGHVQAIQSTDIRAQVAGILQHVAFEGGQDVAAGALLYKIDPAQYEAALAAAKAQLQSAQASLTQAQQNLERQQQLYAHETAAEATLQQAQAQHDIAAANVAAAQAQVQTAEINVGYTTIESPIAGRAGPTLVTAGNLVGPTTGTLTTVVQLDPIRVVFSINERSLVAYRQSHPGATQDEINARFVPKLRLPDGSLYGTQGRVAFAGHTVEATTGTLPVYADFPNPDRLLLPGMLVTAIISPESPPSGFLVPAAAVLQDKQGRYVLLVGHDGKVERRDVTPGQQIEQSASITAGLENGDQVIVEGGQKVHPGQRVTTVPERAASGQAPSSALPSAAPNSGTSQ
ncbi:multidrug efflux system [Bradyrhizobium sp. ORS 375]|nr:multidrug efflux system [Bradyrhizobium sp. ORS 375]